MSGLPSPAEIRRSVDEFHTLFAGGEGVLHSSSAALLLHQHLTDYGFRTKFSVNDVTAVVAAVAESEAAGDELIRVVEECLRYLASFNRSTHARGFTIHRLAMPQVEGRQAMVVEFVNADHASSRIGNARPLQMPQELCRPEPVSDDADLFGDVDLF